MRKRVKRTSGVRHATTPVRPLKKKVQRTQFQPAVQNPVEDQPTVQNSVEVQIAVQNQKEQHLAITHVEVQIDGISTGDKEV